MQLTTERFQFLADALHGTGGFADGSYLKRYPREGDRKYTARKELAWYANPVRRAVSRFVGHIDKRPPIRVLENPLMDVISDDCDWRGNSIGVFWHRFMMEAKARGTMLLLIDAPAELPANRAEQEDMRAAPYLVPILPEHVEEYELDHRGLITSVRYADTMDLDGERVDVSRVWDTEGWRVLKGDEVLESGEHGLGLCPVLAFSETGEFGAEGSFSQLADLGKRLYNLHSELDELLRSQTFSILTYQVPPEQSQTFDANSMAETLGTHNMLVHSGTMPAFISPTSIPTEAYFKAIERLQQTIDEVALNVEPPDQAESGLAMTLRFQSLNASLASFARSMEDLERRVWEIVARWLDITDRTQIEWPTDYGLADLGSEIELYQQMQMMGAPESYLREKMRQIIATDLAATDRDLRDSILGDLDTMSHERPGEPPAVGGE